MTATLRRADNTLTLEGSVDFGNAAALFAEGTALLRQVGGAEVVVDLSRLRSENSIGVAIIVQWLRQASAAGKTLRLQGAPAQFCAIVGVSGLSAVLLPESVSAS